MGTTEKVIFRLFNMPCCHLTLCWVNPRLPNYCPECGARVFMQLKTEAYTQMHEEAWIKIGQPKTSKQQLISEDDPIDRKSKKPT